MAISVRCSVPVCIPCKGFLLAFFSKLTRGVMSKSYIYSVYSMTFGLLSSFPSRQVDFGSVSEHLCLHQIFMMCCRDSSFQLFTSSVHWSL